MKVTDVLFGLCICALVVMMSVHGVPRGGQGRNYLSGCRDRASTCSKMAASDCYIEEENYRCCRSCWNLSRHVSRGPDCQYGDKDPEVCRFVRARHCRGTYYRKLCCESCASFSSSLQED